MYPRTEYEMTQEDLDTILEACRPTPVMFVTGGAPMGSSPQENANYAWRKLGEKMGFDYMTVRPISGKDSRFFTAVPSETEEQRKERLEREEKEMRQAEIDRLRQEISERESRLSELSKGTK